MAVGHWMAGDVRNTNKFWRHSESRFRLLSLALLILQPFCSRIPSQVLAYPSNLFPHRRFTGVYIITAKKKHTHCPFKSSRTIADLQETFHRSWWTTVGFALLIIPRRHSRNEENSFTCSLERALPFPWVMISWDWGVSRWCVGVCLQEKCIESRAGLDVQLPLFESIEGWRKLPEDG